jgi:hypothetical protein
MLIDCFCFEKNPFKVTICRKIDGIYEKANEGENVK